MCRRAYLFTTFSLLLFLLPQRLRGEEISVRPARILLETGTPVKLQLAQTMSSAHAHKKDAVGFVVAEDVSFEGFTIIQAGAAALGSVVEVKRKRPLGMGGELIIMLDWFELTTGERIELIARRKFKGRSHTVRMVVGMAITAAIYLPAAPVFLLTRGRDSEVLKGTELTAYTKSDVSLEAEALPMTQKDSSALARLIPLLPRRVLNGEGREGDMLNLIFLAKENELQDAFSRAGWLKVEKSTPQIAWHLLWQRKHYTKLPMDKLYVFGRPQDYSYSLPDPQSIVARRHHLRIWKTDRQVGGVPLWVGAATHDVAIEFVKRRFRLLHRIDPNVDEEREFIARNLAEKTQVTLEQYVHCTSPVFNAETATGQEYYSDSRILFLGLSQEVAPRLTVTQLAAKLP
jgi:hypothetical protein